MKHEESESQFTKDHGVGIQGYAMRFLEYNSSKAQYNPTEAPVTTDTLSDLGIMDVSWEDNLTEVWTNTWYLHMSRCNHYYITFHYLFQFFFFFFFTQTQNAIN